MPQSPEAGCLFCRELGGELLYEDERLRVVAAPEPDYPGFLRVVWKAHVREMTDLARTDRDRCMRAVFAAESALRTVLQPHKINLASFGNVVPHLHWHVIPRYEDDPHFPSPVWGTRQRDGTRAFAAWDAARIAREIEAAMR